MNNEVESVQITQEDLKEIVSNSLVIIRLRNNMKMIPLVNWMKKQFAKGATCVCSPLSCDVEIFSEKDMNRWGWYKKDN